MFNSEKGSGLQELYFLLLLNRHNFMWPLVHILHRALKQWMKAQAKSLGADSDT